MGDVRSGGGGGGGGGGRVVEQEDEARIRALTVRTIREMRQKMTADLARLHLQSAAAGAARQTRAATVAAPAAAAAQGSVITKRTGHRERTYPVTRQAHPKATRQALKPRAEHLVNTCNLWGCETSEGEETSRADVLRVREHAGALRKAIHDSHYDIRPSVLGAFPLRREVSGGGEGLLQEKERYRRAPEGRRKEREMGQDAGGWWAVARYKSTAGLQEASEDRL